VNEEKNMQFSRGRGERENVQNIRPGYKNEKRPRGGSDMAKKLMTHRKARSALGQGPSSKGRTGELESIPTTKMGTRRGGTHLRMFDASVH